LNREQTSYVVDRAGYLGGTVDRVAVAHTINRTATTHVVEMAVLLIAGQDYVVSSTVDELVSLTQAEYAALSPPDPRTLYFLTD
jgi:hypothetical protein